MSTKINPTHLQRDAYVYVRQSTGHQVRSHPESQRRQYALAEQARGLGFAQVIVIDEQGNRIIRCRSNCCILYGCMCVSDVNHLSET
jgi:hypothetical protein